MDANSQTVTAFLASLQDGMQRLREVQGHYQRLGILPARPFLVLSGRPFIIHEKGTVREFLGCISLGLQTRGADGREYELSVDVLWDDQQWTIQTEAWVEADAGGQDLLRELPERTASDLPTCRNHVDAAVLDLFSFADLITADSCA